MGCGCDERAEVVERKGLRGIARVGFAEVLARAYGAVARIGDRAVIEGAPEDWVPAEKGAPPNETPPRETGALEALPEPEEYDESVLDARSPRDRERDGD